MSRKRVQTDQIYCYCRLPEDGRFMVGCDKCQDWFHGDCAGISRADAKKLKSWFCIGCERQRLFDANQELILSIAQLQRTLLMKENERRRLLTELEGLRKTEIDLNKEIAAMREECRSLSSLVKFSQLEPNRCNVSMTADDKLEAEAAVPKDVENFVGITDDMQEEAFTESMNCSIDMIDMTVIKNIQAEEKNVAQNVGIIEDKQETAFTKCVNSGIDMIDMTLVKNIQTKEKNAAKNVSAQVGTIDDNQKTAFTECVNSGTNVMTMTMSKDNQTENKNAAKNIHKYRPKYGRLSLKKAPITS